MRFSDRVTFVRIRESYYDPIEGKYREGREERITLPCKLSSLGIERTFQLFGEMNRSAIVARLQNPYREPFDYVEIENEEYKVMRQSDYRKGAFYLESVST